MVHVAFTAFVVLGGQLVLRWPRIAWLHVPAAVWGAWIEVAGWIYPLTPLESRLRADAGQTGYQTSFVEHYLLPVLYPAGLTREGQWLLDATCLNAGGPRACQLHVRGAEALAVSPCLRRTSSRRTLPVPG